MGTNGASNRRLTAIDTVMTAAVNIRELLEQGRRRELRADPTLEAARADELVAEIRAGRGAR
jgi:hypothetical protein